MNSEYMPGQNGRAAEEDQVQYTLLRTSVSIVLRHRTAADTIFMSYVFLHILETTSSHFFLVFNSFYRSIYENRIILNRLTLSN